MEAVVREGVGVVCRYVSIFRDFISIVTYVLILFGIFIPLVALLRVKTED